MTKTVAPPVTDHAVVRYCERVLGMDMEGVRRHIWETCAASVTMGAACLRAEGHRFEFAGGRVITVTPDNVLPTQTSRVRTQNRMARR
jgi:hypothetical protein